MPRRDDGSAIRYEFQVFDTPKGNVIIDHLEELKDEGGSVAAFIRDALFFYIQHQAGGQNSTGLGAESDGFGTPLPPNPNPARLQIDEDEDEFDLDIKEVSDGSSAQNFLNSMLGLQQKDD